MSEIPKSDKMSTDELRMMQWTSQAWPTLARAQAEVLRIAQGAPIMPRHRYMVQLMACLITDELEKREKERS